MSKSKLAAGNVTVTCTKCGAQALTFRCACSPDRRSTPKLAPVSRPILMTGEMVRPTLAGTKTQTRRLRGLEAMNIYEGWLEGESTLGPLGYRGLLPWDRYVRTKKAYARAPGLFHWFVGEQDGEVNPIPVKCPYGQVGDRLWVRETWFNNLPEAQDQQHVYYRADPDEPDFDGETIERDGGGWRPSIHMPRWASRLELEITGLRCERLQQITWADIRAEGVACWIPHRRKYRDLPVHHRRPPGRAGAGRGPGSHRLPGDPGPLRTARRHVRRHPGDQVPGRHVARLHPLPRSYRGPR